MVIIKGALLFQQLRAIIIYRGTKMKESQIVALWYILCLLSMIFLAIPILLIIDSSIPDYIILYMFASLMSGMLYYHLIIRFYKPIFLTTVILVVIFSVFYVGFGINEAFVFTFVAWISIFQTIKTINYFNAL